MGGLLEDRETHPARESFPRWVERLTASVDAVRYYRQATASRLSDAGAGNGWPSTLIQWNRSNRDFRLMPVVPARSPF